MAKDEMKGIGKRIKRFRDDAGLSLTELAERSHVSKSYIWSLESDDSPRRPSGNTLYRIADALGVTMSDLLGRELLLDQKVKIPASLQQFAQSEGLPESDVQMLASIRFRGEQPRTAERWQFIYQAIQNSKSMDAKQTTRKA